MFFKRTDNLTSNLTSYDFLKCITVLFMFVDHIGAFFYPDEIWLRVFGRLGFPAWFFLAGFSNSKSISQDVWLGASILVLTSAMYGSHIFPLNALASFIIIRIFLTFYYEKYFASRERLTYAIVAFILLAYPTNYLFEYGTMAFLFAMLGYATRHKDEIAPGRIGRIALFSAVILSASYIQKITFHFDMMQWLTCLSLFAAVAIVLFNFKKDEYPRLTANLPYPLTKLIQFGGRYTLEIYVIHLAAIQTYLFITDPLDKFEFFMPKLMM